MNHDLSYYRKIQGVSGASSAKETQIIQRKAELIHYFEMSQDCEDVKVNGVDQKLIVTKSTDPTIKHVVSKPDEAIYLGDIIVWNSADWIVDTMDADTRINSNGKMHRCNITMKWLDELGAVRSYSGFCEDATKYSEGVAGDKMIQIGDFQIKVKIHLDEHSAKINRDKRFLLDMAQFLPQMEATGSHPSAYVVTRRNVLTGNLGGHGYVELTLVETAYSQNDNPTLMIADYYSADDVYELTVTDSDNLTVAKGSTYTLSCSATKNGTALNQSSILFQSSDTSIATVSTAGKIAGVANGTCVVTVKAGNVQQRITVTVESASTTASIKIYTDDSRIVYGQNKNVSFAAIQNGAEVSTTFSCSISSLLSVASITETGSDYVVIAAVNDSEKIGEKFTLTVTSTALSATASKEFEIAGWF